LLSYNEDRPEKLLSHDKSYREISSKLIKIGKIGKKLEKLG